MNILIIGAGGREHALTWKALQSPKVDKVFVAPGNAGTNEIAENVNISVNDFKEIEKLVLEKNIELVIVGPEEPLVKGISDYFEKTASLKNVRIFGPKSQGAQLEGSKDFSKEFMFKHDIPTAKYATFNDSQVKEAVDYLDSYEGPYVLKADGLAAGKGVIITEDKQEAKDTIVEMLEMKKFGDASAKVVVEEFLSGLELSVFVVTDGKEYVILPNAKDYKRIGEGDTGLNTGGMGALSPVPFADKVFMDKVEERIIKKTISGLQKDAIDFTGFIFFGLIEVNNEPFVIEYNVRLGDPETEAIIPRIKSDLIEIIDAATKNELSGKTIEIDSRAGSTVMLVAGGYPEAYEKGKEISGIKEVKDAIPFHAGTTVKDGKVVTNGGRVIALSALGEDIFDALDKSFEAAKTVTWDKRYYRTDLGFDLK